MVSAFLKVSMIGTKLQPVNLSLPKLIRFCQTASPCWVCIIHIRDTMFKINRTIAVDWLSTKPGSTPASKLLTCARAPNAVKFVSRFPKVLRKLSSWLHEHQCSEVCLKSFGKYWILVFNVLEETCKVTLAHSKYTKPPKRNKTDRKNAQWICDLFMYNMIKPSFIPSPAIRHLCNLIHYRTKLTNMLTSEKNRAKLSDRLQPQAG